MNPITHEAKLVESSSATNSSEGTTSPSAPRNRVITNLSQSVLFHGNLAWPSRSDAVAREEKQAGCGYAQYIVANYWGERTQTGQDVQKAVTNLIRKYCS